MKERGRPRSFDREEALKRAMEVFWAKGFEAASIAELTRAMDINAPSLYAAFGDKEALFREAVALYCETEGGRIWSGLAAAPTARDGVAAMLRASAEEFTRAGRPRGCLIVLGAVYGEGLSDAACADLRRQRLAAVDLLRKRIEKDMTAGALPKTVDSKGVAYFYATVQHGMVLNARDGATRKALLKVAENAMAAWSALVAG